MPAARVRSSIVSKSGTMSRAAKDFPVRRSPRGRLLCEKNDGENVALVVRHADDVGPDRHRRDVLQDPADGPERRHALPRLGGEARAGGNERPGR